MSIRFDAAGEGYTRAISGITNTGFTFCGWARMQAADSYGVIVGLNSQSNWADVFLNWGNTTDALSMVIGSYRTGAGGGDYEVAFASRPAIGEDFFYYVRSGGSGLEAGWRRPTDSAWVTATCTSVTWSGATPTLRVNTDAFGEWGNRRQGALYVYDNALTDSELLNQMTQVDPIESAWGFYPFNDPDVADNVTDQSGNGRNLTSSGTLTVEENFPIGFPTFVAMGTPAGGTGAVTPAIPATYAVGDLLILSVNCKRAETLNTPSGWTLVASAVPTADNKLTVFSRIATSGQAAPALNDPGDHTYAVIHAWRDIGGGTLTVNQSNTSVLSTASTSVSWPSVTTTYLNQTIVNLMADGADSAAARFSSPVNANLTNIVERFDLGITSNSGGGLIIVSGDLATPGSSGSTTGTLTSATQAHVTLAIGLQETAPTLSDIIGASSLTFAPTGTLTQPAGAMEASAVMTFASTSALLGSGVLAGPSTLTFGYTANLEDPNAVTYSTSNTAATHLWAGAVTSTTFTGGAKLASANSDVRVVVSVNSDLSSPAIYSSPVASNNGYVTATVSGLTPETDYYWGIRIGSVVYRGNIGQTRTTPTEGSTASFYFAFGSCNDTDDTPIFEFFRTHSPKLTFFQHLGDFNYDDNNSANVNSHHADFDGQMTGVGNTIGPLVKAIPTYHTFGDHDFAGNESDASFTGAAAARTMWRQRMPNPNVWFTGTNDPLGYSYTVGRVRFIVPDGRGARDGLTDMFGSTQMTRILQEITDAEAAGQFIVFFSEAPFSDADFPSANRVTIANHVKSLNLEGQIIMLCGDAHAIQIDDGTNHDFATGGGAKIPVIHASPFNRTNSTKGGPYSHGVYDSYTQQGGVMQIIDTGGDSIYFNFVGYRNTGTQVVSFDGMLSKNGWVDPDSVSGPPTSSASSTLTFSETASLAATGSLSGSSTLTVSSTTTISGLASMTASTSLTFASNTVVLNGIVYIEASVLGIAFDSLSAVNGVGQSVGTVGINFSPGTVVLTGESSLVSSSSLSFTPSASISGILSAVGTSSTAFSASANLLGTASAEGSSAFSFLPFGSFVSPIYSDLTTLQFATDGSLIGTGQFAASNTFVFSSVSQLSGIASISGNSAGLSFTTDANIVAISDGLNGQSITSLTTSGTVHGIASLVGSSAETFAVSATINGIVFRTGESSVTISETANLTGQTSVAATTNLNLAVPDTELVGIGNIAGASSLLFASTSAMRGSASVQGSSSLTIGTSGVQTGEGSLASATMPIFASTGTLNGVGQAVASSNIAFSSTAFLNIKVPIIGSLNISASPSGTLAGTGTITALSGFVFNNQAAIGGFFNGAGSSSLSFIVSSGIKGDGGLVSANDPIFSITADATIFQVHPIIGTDTLTFTGQGTLQKKIVVDPDIIYLSGIVIEREIVVSATVESKNIDLGWVTIFT